ncbi:MAG: hypothetical protein ISP85_03320, partial [Candidatus Poseidonia sp.]|nr:hypothetical protein [Poseidonia sp.]
RVIFAYPSMRRDFKGVELAESVKNASFLSLWDTISTVVRDCAKGLEIAVDEPGDLFVKTEHGRPFARVRIQKQHVGIYLLPLYYFPEVLPEALLKKKSGKSTLKFQHGDVDILHELSTLLENCLAFIEYY